MGSHYTIVIHGDRKATSNEQVDIATKEIVANLKGQGHHIHHATVTHGYHSHVDGADEDNSGDEKAAG
jgi:hypothetical protein